MKLTLEGLKDRQAWEKAGIQLPSYDIEKVAEHTKQAPVWVHFGAGNIFRIFIGGLADKLLSQGDVDKGITCVETFDFDVVDKIYKLPKIRLFPLIGKLVAPTVFYFDVHKNLLKYLLLYLQSYKYIITFANRKRKTTEILLFQYGESR